MRWGRRKKEKKTKLVLPKEYKVWKAGKINEEEKNELLLQAIMRTMLQ